MAGWCSACVKKGCTASGILKGTLPSPVERVSAHCALTEPVLLQPTQLQSLPAMAQHGSAASHTIQKKGYTT